MSHQATKLGQDREQLPSFLEAMRVISPYKLWWQNQMDWGSSKTSSCLARVRHQPHGSHSPPVTHLLPGEPWLRI